MDPATTEIYTLSLHDALPILAVGGFFVGHGMQKLAGWFGGGGLEGTAQFFEQNLGLKPGRVHATAAGAAERSEEHTSELQSHVNLVCRLLLEKKKKNKNI